MTGRTGLTAAQLEALHDFVARASGAPSPDMTRVTECLGTFAQKFAQEFAQNFAKEITVTAVDLHAELTLLDGKAQAQAQAQGQGGLAQMTRSQALAVIAAKTPKDGVWSPHDICPQEFHTPEVREAIALVLTAVAVLTRTPDPSVIAAFATAPHYQQIADLVRDRERGFGT